jgi:hypothetical protein
MALPTFALNVWETGTPVDDPWMVFFICADADGALVLTPATRPC